MTEQANFETETNLNPYEEKELLKERAKTLGITVAGNISVDTLRKRINDKLAGVVNDDEEGVAVTVTPKTESKQELRERLIAESMALVRCRIYNLNPSKRDLPGEIITVGNRFIGTVSKFIPFGEGTDNGYHIPKVIYDDLKVRQFQQVTTKTINGKIDIKTRMVPEYNVEILPPLTDEELQELALRQAAAERLEEV